VRYLVDQALCCGHGQCAALAPEVYSLDDDGFNKEDASAGPAVAVASLLAEGDTGPAYDPVPYFWSDQFGHKLQCRDSPGLMPTSPSIVTSGRRRRCRRHQGPGW
jgi:hypothetical protein